MALTPGKAAMVIHNFKVQTGHVVCMAELEGGYLKGQLCLQDYDIKQQASYFRTICSGGTTPGGPLWECSLMHLPQEQSRILIFIDFLFILPVKRVDGSTSPWSASSSCRALTGFVGPYGRSRSFINWLVPQL